MLEHADDAPEDDEERFEVWPENTGSLLFFIGVSNQWRVVAGFAGTVFLGLDRTAIEAEMRMRGVKKKDQAELLEDVLAMERAALKELNRKRNG